MLSDVCGPPPAIGPAQPTRRSIATFIASGAACATSDTVGTASAHGPCRLASPKRVPTDVHLPASSVRIHNVATAVCATLSAVGVRVPWHRLPRGSAHGQHTVLLQDDRTPHNLHPIGSHDAVASTHCRRLCLHVQCAAASATTASRWRMSQLLRHSVRGARHAWHHGSGDGHVRHRGRLPHAVGVLLAMHPARVVQGIRDSALR